MIKAVASDGTSTSEDRSDSAFSLTGTPPSTPTLNDPGTTDNDSSYTVSWSSVSGAASYTLEEDTICSFSSPTVVYSGAGTSKYITGKSDGTYYYRVKACNAGGCSGWSNVEDIEVIISKKVKIRVPEDYQTIQAAVDAVSPGDTIIVSAGIYTENINVNKPLTIRSENGAENCIVQAANSNDHVFEVTADHVNISGFTVKGASDWREAGIYLRFAKRCSIYGNIVSGNSDGICLFGNISSNSFITNNSASNNDFGIMLWGSNDNIVTNNIANSNNHQGIHLYSSSNNIITNNIANSNNDDGIFIDSSSNNNLITNNIASSNNEGGIGFYSSSSNNIITRNNANSNDWGIILCSSCNNNTFYLNNFINKRENVHSESTNIWNSPSEISYNYKGKTYTNLLGNYWSDYTGSDANDDGIGDTVYSINSDKDNYPLVTPFENYEKGNRLSDWPMSKHDAARTGYNADETKLSPPLVKKWVFEGISGDVFDTISTAGGTIYIGMEASTEGRDSNKVYAIDGATGLKSWEFILDAGGRGAMGVTPAIANGLVYFGGQGDDKLYALNAKTGKKVWEFTGVGTMYCSQPAVTDGVVYAKGQDTLYALDAYTGVKKWEFPTAGRGRNSPAIVNNIVYIGSSDGFLYAIDAKTGTEKWSLPDSSRMFSYPLVSNDTVYIDASSTVIKALNASIGSLRWEVTLGEELPRLGDGIFALANDILYVSICEGTDEHGKLYALNASTGSEIWSFDTDVAGIHTPAVANGIVYVCGWKNKMVYALDATTGVEKWHYQCDGTISLSPIIADGLLYAGTWSKLYAFEP